MTPTKVNLRINQGATFTWPFYWYSDIEVVKTIIAVQRSYPTLVQSVAHGILAASEQPVALLDVPDWLAVARLPLASRIYATRVDADTFSVKVDGTGEDAYSGTAGRLVYNAPMDVSAWDARMQVRESIDDAAPIVEFTNGGGHITLGADGSIVLGLSDTETDALDFTSAVYDLELVDIANNVTRLVTGKVTLSPQITR